MSHEFRIKTYYGRTVTLDDDAGGAALPIRIRRFTIAQLQAFLPGFERMVSPPSERVFARQPEGPEQELEPAVDGKSARYRVPFVEVRRRRLAEMTPEQRAAFDQAAAEDQAAILEFCRGVIAEHVWLPPNVRLVIEDEKGQEHRPTSGAALAQAFEGNLVTLMLLTRLVGDANMVGADAKKAWRSSSSSTPSSNAPQDRGERPAATAMPVGRRASARGARASARRRRTRSGSVGT